MIEGVALPPERAVVPGAVLDVDGLEVTFPTDAGPVPAVRGVSFAVRQGDVLCIVGESGSGKSVTALAIMGLLPSSAVVSGSVVLEGAELVGADEEDLRRARGDAISMIFQDPMTSLNPVQRIGTQIVEMIQAHRDITKDDAWARSVGLLDVVGIPQSDARARSYPHEFSGGMRQRAMIAMAIANDPNVLIADEPTTALDVTVQAQVLEALKKARDETSAAMILITHDLGVVAQMATQVLVMYAGKAVEVATADELFESPRMPYTVGLLGSLPRIDEDGVELLRPIKGSPPSLINLPPGCPFAPRCPLAIDLCSHEEPMLIETDHVGHYAACHRWQDVAAEQKPVELYEAAAVTDEEPLLIEEQQ